ncbi:AraC family transcriptional regulator [Sabulilitoribacter arenilitoris]|uniref:AraC family transcriptional regulator n=1 Tax=Wocania arenilitoris TaxID=2044858 RepID=A0AAE3ER16_9FLAO|nr:AraC family transcriptional regulator [Wocania arenilitoris]MCF7568804.1 AraC family transcriptional regulator [Wocania arenilitoris]
MHGFRNHVFTLDADQNDKCLIYRILELNPDMGLSDPNPQKYDNLNYLDRCKKTESEKPLSNTFESQGILLQLFSRFKPLSQENNDYNDTSSRRIIQTIQYINNNLNKNLSVKLLAQEACLTPDYFSRLFLQVTKSRPIEFIQRKRIENVQLLLITTNHSLEKIAELSGLSNSSYLIRLFKRYTGTVPGKWKDHYQKEKNLFFQP